MNRRLAAGLLTLALATGLAACGDDDDAGDAGDAAPAAAEQPSEAGRDFPVTVRDVMLEEAPERIVSLSPTATEMLFAIGAGDQVVAADEHSNHPEEAPDTDLSGFDPNVEAIAGHEPDLVVASNDTDDLVASLGALDIPVLLLPAATDVDEVYAQIEDLGVATGHADEASEVVEDVSADVEAAVEEYADDAEGLTYYYELDPTYYSVTSRTFMGQLLGRLGLVNIADEAQAEANDYPQLSAEFIVDQDPDLVLLADTKCCQQSAETVAARDGWQDLRAVKHGGVVELDDDVASRWGPRIAELLVAVGEAAEKVAAAA